MLKQARAAGITAKFLGFDGLYDPGFPKGAGAAATGAIVTCPCLPAEEAGGTFSADYQKEYGVAPGSYGAEGYDGATIILEAYKAGKKTSRADMLACVKAYDKQGVSKYLKFDRQGRRGQEQGRHLVVRHRGRGLQASARRSSSADAGSMRRPEA